MVIGGAYIHENDWKRFRFPSVLATGLIYRNFDLLHVKLRCMSLIY